MGTPPPRGVGGGVVSSLRGQRDRCGPVLREPAKSGDVAALAATAITLGSGAVWMT
jgi:hypothetical protein